MVGSLTTGALAAMLGGEVVGRDDLAVGDLAGIDDASPGALTFIRSPQYAERWAASSATAAIVSRGIDVPRHDKTRRALIYVDNADQALVALLEQLAQLAAPPPPPPGVHSSAIVEEDAEIDPSASVGPLCVIGAGARIGPGTVLHARVTVGRGSAIGARCVVHPGVVMYHNCTIGDDCLIHANVSIGADGFGFIPHPGGQGVVKVPHLGTVVIGNRVEIGAGSCIDRGKFSPTTIGDGAKLDNLVQVGHNVRIGEHALLCGQVGVGGSSTIGTGAMLGGQVGVADNHSVGDGAMVGAQSGVMKNVLPGQSVFGTPCRPGFDTLRTTVKTDRTVRLVRDLQRRIEELEAAQGQR